MPVLGTVEAHFVHMYITLARRATQRSQSGLWEYGQQSGNSYLGYTCECFLLGRSWGTSWMIDSPFKRTGQVRSQDRLKAVHCHCKL